MINIAICDDEHKISGEVETRLLELKEKYELNLTTEVYSDSLELLKDMKYKGVSYDILLLDIEINFMNGIELAEFIRLENNRVVIMYMTNHPNYAIKAYSVHPYQFFTKPIEWQLFDKSCLEVIDNINNSKVYYHYAFNKVQYKKMICDIQYFYSEKRVIHIIDKNGNDEKFSDKMNNVEAILKEGKHKFLRTHQSYLVNYDFVTALGAHSITLVDGTTFSVTPERSKSVAAEYARFVRSER